MGKITLSIDKITPGMKLAEPIINSSDVTLMPAGIRLTPMFIVRLKKWNLTELAVFVDKPQEKSADADKPRVAAVPTLTADQEEFAGSIVTEITRMFVNVKDDPLMMQLRAVAAKRLIAHGKGGMLNVMRRLRREAEEAGRSAPEKAEETA